MLSIKSKQIGLTELSLVQLRLSIYKDKHMR